MVAAQGGGTGCTVRFEPCRSVEYGGVLLLLPFLLANGLLGYNNHYAQRTSGYYHYDQAILTLALMILCRIKSVEQLKHAAPGEFGKLLGLDRCPEARCLRTMIKELVNQNQAGAWNTALARQWIEDEATEIFYTDGHVQVYHGDKANLGKKHVSRQRLCLPGMVEFWVNNGQGLPYFYITGQVNEKLQQAIEENIVPQLNEYTKDKKQAGTENTPPDTPRYTLAFDREAFSPELFGRLWDQHQVAVLTYKKNVKESWADDEFVPMEVETHLGKITMALSEKTIVADGVPMREIRQLCDNGHQTSIVTTNKILPIGSIALNMYARWSQENFFRYMRQEYDLDRITQYGVEQLDGNIKVVNREYSNLTHQLKKVREKIAHRKAQLYQLMEHNNKTPLEETPANMKKQIKVREEIEELETEENSIIQLRKQQPYYTTIDKMPQATRYNKLITESKHIQNIVKMICYRAETAFVSLMCPFFSRAADEKRALAKSIIYNRADIDPDYENKTLTITLYSMATPRDNHAVEEICTRLNQSQTLFPGTELTMLFKTWTSLNTMNQEV